MRRLVCTAAALLGVGVAAATAAAPEPIDPPAVLDEGGAASAGVSPSTPGATPTTVKLALRYPLLCGRPRPGTLAITFPADETVPRTIARSTVRVANARTTAVSVAGETITVALAPPPIGAHRMGCHSIALGRLSLTIGTGARLGNPAAAGTYVITVKHGTTSYPARFTLTG